MNGEIIYKLRIPECLEYSYEVGCSGVLSIEQDIIQTGSGPDTTPSKLIYRVKFEDGKSVEIDANIRGLVIYKRPI